MADTDSYPLFISYERRDSAGWSLMLYDRLSERFGDGAVFRDSLSIPAGARWKPIFKRQVSACRGLILVIGPDWTEPRVLQKLNDPKGWVYNEILTALESKKEIFPVLFGGAVAPPLDQLPAAIRPAIDDFNHFRLHDDRTWKQELENLFADIEQRTGLVRRARAPSAEIQRYDRVLARLDRNRQTAELRAGFDRGGQLFVATGARKGGFRHFAIRCLLDVLSTQGGAGGSEGERVVALSWGRFTDPETPAERKREFLCDVAEKLLTETGRQDPQRLLERIGQAVRQTRRPTVIYCTVTAGSRLDADRAEEWFGCWREILRAGPPRQVVVILFVERGWWPLPAGSPVPSGACDASVRPKLGAVYRRDLRLWLEGDVRNYAEGGLWSKINRRCERALRWRWGRGFDDLCDAIIEVWSTEQG